VDFSRGSRKDFSNGWAKRGKISFFPHEAKKTRQFFFAKNVIGKCPILKSRGPCAPSDAHDHCLCQWFPTCLGLWHPAEENYILRHPVANPHNFDSRFDDSLKMYF